MTCATEYLSYVTNINTVHSLSFAVNCQSQMIYYITRKSNPSRLSHNHIFFSTNSSSQNSNWWEFLPKTFVKFSATDSHFLLHFFLLKIKSWRVKKIPDTLFCCWQNHWESCSLSIRFVSSGGKFCRSEWLAFGLLCCDLCEFFLFWFWSFFSVAVFLSSRAVTKITLILIGFLFCH